MIPEREPKRQEKEGPQMDHSQKDPQNVTTYSEVLMQEGCEMTLEEEPKKKEKPNPEKDHLLKVLHSVTSYEGVATEAGDENNFVCLVVTLRFPGLV